METNFSTQDINNFISQCSESILLKSSRRLFFNYLEKSIEDRGHFHVDQMYGGGTGILIKYKEIFFLLTAKHVIDANTKFDYQSESPFWITSASREWPDHLYGFLMPKRVWHIGQGISWTSRYTDPEDILLIELFYPNHRYWPDCFLNLDQNDLLMEEGDLFEGQLLLTSGYPFSDNEYFFEDPPAGYTHFTNSSRKTLPAIFNIKDDEQFMRFSTDDNISHEDFNGFSGSPVSNVQPQPNTIKLAGMITSGGNNLARFIPSYAFRDCLYNFQDFPVQIIDPSAQEERSSIDELSVIYKEFREMFGR